MASFLLIKIFHIGFLTDIFLHPASGRQSCPEILFANDFQVYK